VHNVRSALDHIVYALAEYKLGSSRTDDDRKKGQFPITLTARGFQGQLKRGRLYGLPVKAITLIRRLQPEKRSDVLWVLSELDNFDKHRTIQVVSATASDPSASINLHGLRVASVRHHAGGLWREGDTFIRFSRTDPTLRAAVAGHVKVQFKAAVFVAFLDAPAADVRVTALLREAIHRVKNRIVPGFKPFFN
jgi:hypothetical protein